MSSSWTIWFHCFNFACMLEVKLYQHLLYNICCAKQLILICLSNISKTEKIMITSIMCSKLSSCIIQFIIHFLSVKQVIIHFLSVRQVIDNFLMLTKFSSSVFVQGKLSPSTFSVFSKLSFFSVISNYLSTFFCVEQAIIFYFLSDGKLSSSTSSVFCKLSTSV